MHLSRHSQRFAQDPIAIDFEQLRAREALILQAKKAKNTTITYASAWRSFSTWCAAAELVPLPAAPATVRQFVSWCLVDGYRMLTIQTRLAAIRHYHAAAGYPSPCDEALREYLSCARRHLKEPKRGKAAITVELLCRILDAFPETSIGLRNRAMILLAFASGWRKSEVVALRRADVEIGPAGLRLHSAHSKTDQEARGRVIGIQRGRQWSTCPVAALECWLRARGDWEGALFPRFDGAGRMTRVAPAAKGDLLLRPLLRALAEATSEPERYSAHSLRAGMITEATRNGATEAAIMQRTGHRSTATLQRYIRPATCFDFNPLANVL